VLGVLGVLARRALLGAGLAALGVSAPVCARAPKHAAWLKQHNSTNT
jgi:hypothetical protein